ncbi:EamA family transporter [Hungatella sp.]|uniref:EamA family transporter n=1 Tax=Hungatella sp. TaxID=2613924 RepID=UPI003993F589
MSAGAVASTAFQLGTKYIGAQNASMLSTFEPLTSVAVGILVYHELMTGRTVMGILAILISVIIVSCPDHAVIRKE